MEQCLQLDAIREYSETIREKNLKAHILASTITTMTYAVSSTTHLAQYLKPTNEKRSIKLIARRKYNIIDQVIKRLISLHSFPLPEKPAKIFQKDFSELLETFPIDSKTIVYVDPPYFKEHYSRYYHILDTFYLYDYPELTFNPRLGKTTIGRYRENRIISDFGLKSSVERAFGLIFKRIRDTGANLAVSYADTSLVNREKIINLAISSGLHCQISECKLMHSGQGKPHNNVVTEYLFLFKP